MIKRYFVIGNPIVHSLSPQIHHQFAEQTRVNICYEKYLAPLDGFEDCLDKLEKVGAKGANVTAPFKQHAFAVLNESTKRAQLAGAVNTITFTKDGKRKGDNTDGVGLVTDLTKNLDIKLADKNILLIGAGGAARGVLPALLEQHPNNIAISNRTFEKAEKLTNVFGRYGKLTACKLNTIPEQTFDIVINASNADFNDTTLSTSIISKYTVCYDMNYAKKRTSFLEWCQQNNATRIFNGLGMLVEQAALSFSIWHNTAPDTTNIIQQLKR